MSNLCICVLKVALSKVILSCFDCTFFLWHNSYFSKAYLKNCVHCRKLWALIMLFIVFQSEDLMYYSCSHKGEMRAIVLFEFYLWSVYF